MSFTLEQEQTAFDSQLESLLDEHEGEFVLFKNGQPVEYFSAREEAFSAGLKRYGADEVFLVAEVAKRSPHAVSLAWEAGVMFGQ